MLNSSAHDLSKNVMNKHNTFSREINDHNNNMLMMMMMMTDRGDIDILRKELFYWRENGGNYYTQGQGCGVK